MVNELPAFYRTRKFITANTRANHLSLSWATPIQSIPSSNFLKIHFNIIPPSTPRSSLKFSQQNPLYTSSATNTCRMSCLCQYWPITIGSVMSAEHLPAEEYLRTGLGPTTEKLKHTGSRTGAGATRTLLAPIGCSKWGCRNQQAGEQQNF